MCIDMGIRKHSRTRTCIDYISFNLRYRCHALVKGAWKKLLAESSDEKVVSH